MMQFLTNDERQKLSLLSKELHTYLDFYNIKSKENIIISVKNNLIARSILGEDLHNKLSKIKEDEVNLKESYHLILKASYRIINQVYPQLNTDNYTKSTITELAHRTIKFGKIKDENIEKTLKDIEDIEVGNNLKYVSNYKYDTYYQFNLLRKKEEKNIEEILKSKHINSLNELQKFPKDKIENILGNDKKTFLNSLKKMYIYDDFCKGINASYNEFLKLKLPALSDEHLNNIPIKDKEYLTAYLKYHDTKPLQSIAEIKEYINNPKSEFTDEESQKIIKYFLAPKKEKEEYLSSFLNKKEMRGYHLLFNPITSKLILNEFKQKKNIYDNDIKQIENILNKKDKVNNQYINQNLKDNNIESDFESLNYSDLKHSSIVKKTFNHLIIQFLNEDYESYQRKQQVRKLKEVEREMMKKSKQQNHRRR